MFKKIVEDIYGIPRRFIKRLFPLYEDIPELQRGKLLNFAKESPKRYKTVGELVNDYKQKYPENVLIMKIDPKEKGEFNWRGILTDKKGKQSTFLIRNFKKAFLWKKLQMFESRPYLKKEQKDKYQKFLKKYREI